MAQKNYTLKLGSKDAEIITGATVGTSETEISHNLGVIPTIVGIIPSATATGVIASTTAATSSTISLTAESTEDTSVTIVLLAGETKYKIS